MKRIAAFFLSLVLLLSLCACGGSADPNLGVYKLSSFMGMSLEAYAQLSDLTTEEAADSFKVELKADGKATFTIDDDPTDLNWKLDGESFSLYDDEESIDGTLKDGTLTLDIEGFEVVLVK